MAPGAMELMDQLITQAVEAAYKFGFPLDAGAVLVNDISAFAYDSAMGPLVAARGVPAILMHTRGRPQDMYAHADYGDVAADVTAGFDDQWGTNRERFVANIYNGLWWAGRLSDSL